MRILKVMTSAPLALLGLGLLAGATGCGNIYHSEDFERHRASQITLPPGGSEVFYFDAMIDPTAPENDPAAEERRMEWLAAWLETRKMCPSGYEVLDRRPFRFEESNPGRFDLRYEVRCRTSPAAE